MTYSERVCRYICCEQLQRQLLLLGAPSFSLYVFPINPISNLPTFQLFSKINDAISSQSEKFRFFVQALLGPNWV